MKTRAMRTIGMMMTWMRTMTDVIIIILIHVVVIPIVLIALVLIAFPLILALAPLLLADTLGDAFSLLLQALLPHTLFSHPTLCPSQPLPMPVN